MTRVKSKFSLFTVWWIFRYFFLKSLLTYYMKFTLSNYCLAFRMSTSKIRTVIELFLIIGRLHLQSSPEPCTRGQGFLIMKQNHLEENVDLVEDTSSTPKKNSPGCARQVCIQGIFCEFFFSLFPPTRLLSR